MTRLALIARRSSSRPLQWRRAPTTPTHGPRSPHRTARRQSPTDKTETIPVTTVSIIRRSIILACSIATRPASHRWSRDASGTLAPIPCRAIAADTTVGQHCPPCHVQQRLRRLDADRPRHARLVYPTQTARAATTRASSQAC